jgi:hypothetical protein
MISRRIFLKNGGLALVSLGFAPTFLARTVAAADARRRVLITIFQRGAVDGLNMIVPFGERAYYAARPSLAAGMTDGPQPSIGPSRRHAARLSAVQALYQWQEGQHSPEEIIEQFVNVRTNEAGEAGMRRDADKPLFVSLNPPFAPRDELTFGKYMCEHPQYNQAAFAAQKRLGDIQGRRHTWFCGAWTGYGFHEDGIRSGLAVAEALVAYAPWREVPAELAEAAE